MEKSGFHDLFECFRSFFFTPRIKHFPFRAPANVTAQTIRKLNRGSDRDAEAEAVVEAVAESEAVAEAVVEAEAEEEAVAEADSRFSCLLIHGWGSYQ